MITVQRISEEFALLVIIEEFWSLQVSAVSFRVFYIEAKVQLDGKDVTVAAQIDHLQPIEHGNVNLDKFQAKLAAGKNELRE